MLMVNPADSKQRLATHEDAEPAALHHVGRPVEVCLLAYADDIRPDFTLPHMVVSGVLTKPGESAGHAVFVVETEDRQSRCMFSGY